MYRTLRQSASIAMVALSVGTISACRPSLETAEDWHRQGIIQTQKGNLHQAIESLDQAVQREPDNATMLINRGLVRDELGDHESAIADYDQAIALGENLRAAYYNRGNAHHNMAQFENTVADYSEAIKLEKDFAYAYVNRAINFEALGETTRAVEDLNAALEIFSANDDTENVERITTKISEMATTVN